MSHSGSALQTNPSLLVRLRETQDQEAWRIFLELYGPVVFQCCRRKSLQHADATDVTQDVLIEVVNSIRTFVYQPEKGRFRDWLWTLTRRRLARFFARVRENRELPLDHDPIEGAVAADAEWSSDFNARVFEMALERARPCFEDSTWNAFRRVWIDDVSPADAAAELQISIDSVYLSKSRVLKRLEEEIRLLADDLPETVPLN
jgi:RNA polymerase sigma-70 factor (ECF subfamily)